MPDETFLFELYTEEIPSFYQKRAISDWREKLLVLLKENLLEFSNLETGGTSRRIYAIINQLKPCQATVRKKIKGPPQELCKKDGENTAAMTGFAKKAGIQPDAVSFEIWDGKMYATAEVNTGGKTIGEVLPDIFENLIKTQNFTRSMRWGNSSLVYARPVIHYYAIYGSSVLKFESGIWNNIPFASTPVGHFILGPNKVTLNGAADYINALMKSGITVNPEHRLGKIKDMLNKVAEKDSVIFSKKLLEEVNFLVEKPAVIRGSFPKEFLQMPPIVILSEMEEHQKYFGLQTGKSQTLSHEFLIVANADENDAEALNNIRKGNEKVLRARLSDGLYFYNEDRKRKLADRTDDLKRMVFHEGMGSIFDKKERIKEIATRLSSYIYPDVDHKKLYHTCDMIKADLTTRLVYEFDHLQGEIGSIYAEMDGEDTEVSCAIREHYLPRNESDSYPQKKLGLLLSISDKLDNIISGHILGKQPSSSHDPLGLRRQTLYIIEMLIQNRIILSMNQVLLDIIKTVYKINDEKKSFTLASDIVQFFTGRLATIFEKEDFDRKLINAILNSGGDYIYSKYLQLEALRTMKQDNDFLLMLATFKRMKNIVKDFLVKNPEKTISGKVIEDLFELSQEKRLFEISQKLASLTLKISGNEKAEYEALFKYIASVKNDVDDFFDNVMVMHDNEKIKINRLAVLNVAVTSIDGLLNIEMLQ